MERELAARQAEAAAAPRDGRQPMAKPSNNVIADRGSKPSENLPERAPGHAVAEVASSTATGPRRPSRRGAVIEGTHTTAVQDGVGLPENHAGVVVGGERDTNSSRTKAFVPGSMSPRRSAMPLFLCVNYLVALLVILTIALHTAHRHREAESRKRPVFLVPSPSPPSNSTSSEATPSSSRRTSKSAASSDEFELLTTYPLPSPSSADTSPPKRKKSGAGTKADVTKKTPLTEMSREAAAGEEGPVNSTEATDVEIGSRQRGHHEHRLSQSGTLGNSSS